MRGRDILKELIKERDTTNAELAHQLGVTPATIWERLNNKNVKDIPLSLMAEMCDALGYQVVVIPYSTELPENARVVTFANGDNAIRTETGKIRLSGGVLNE